MTEYDIRNRSGEAIDHTFHAGTRADVLVILGHGLTGNKDRPLLVALASGLVERGWPCLRVSFSGNGESEGNFGNSCISKGIGDLQSVFDSVPDDVNITYVGHSMGSAIGVLTAARDLRIRALVSLAGMTYSAAFVEREFSDVIPGEGCMWEDEAFPLSVDFVTDLKMIGETLPAVEELTQPWLLIHGDADDVVPIADSRDAYEAARGQKKLLELPGSGHLFEDESYPFLIDAVDKFLNENFG